MVFGICIHQSQIILNSTTDSLEREFSSAKQAKPAMNLNVKDESNANKQQQQQQQQFNKRPSSRESAGGGDRERERERNVHHQEQEAEDAKNLIRREGGNNNNNNGLDASAGRDRSSGAPVLPNPKDRVSPLGGAAIPLTSTPGELLV